MTDAEIIELIARLQRGEGDDRELDVWLSRLEAAIPCPHVSDLIFYGNSSDGPEEILRKARQYRPINL